MQQLVRQKEIVLSKDFTRLDNETGDVVKIEQEKKKKIVGYTAQLKTSNMMSTLPTLLHWIEYFF